MRDTARWRRLIAAMWLGLLLAVAGIATPAPFATLAAADAGRVVARVLATEAYCSVALGVVLLLLERRAAALAAARGAGSQFGAGVALALGAIFCTVAGYFGLQPLMTEARAGIGRFGFGQLHAASLAFYGVKVLLVAALAWRAAATPAPSSSR
jgi:Domain of unknown function (DUF4149)